MFHWTNSLLGTHRRTIAYSPLDGGETFTVKYEDGKLRRRIGPDEWQTLELTPGWDADDEVLNYILSQHGYTPGDAANV